MDPITPPPVPVLGRSVPNSPDPALRSIQIHDAVAHPRRHLKEIPAAHGDSVGPAGLLGVGPPVDSVGLLGVGSPVGPVGPLRYVFEAGGSLEDDFLGVAFVVRMARRRRPFQVESDQERGFRPEYRCYAGHRADGPGSRWHSSTKLMSVSVVKSRTPHPS